MRRWPPTANAIAQQTDALITTFRDVVAAYRSEGTADQRFAVIDALIGSRSDTLLEQCEAHIANTTNTYLPFLWPCFKGYRATLFRLLHALELQVTTGIRDWKARSAYCWRTGSASANGSLPLKHRLSGTVRSNEHPWWMCRGFPRVGGGCSAMCVHVQPIHAAFARRSGLTPARHIENFHNFAWIEDGLVVHRKGATPAGKGVLGIIPGSMATNSYIVAGNGNPESLQSASHGAGRRFSRTEARNTISMADVRRLLAERDVLAEGVAVDEAPQAYKDVERVIELQVAAGLITPIARMRPIAVIMAGEKGED